MLKSYAPSEKSEMFIIYNTECTEFSRKTLSTFMDCKDGTVPLKFTDEIFN